MMTGEERYRKGRNANALNLCIGTELRQKSSSRVKQLPTNPIVEGRPLSFRKKATPKVTLYLKAYA